MRRHISTALLYTLVTTLIFGIGYPLVITGISQIFFRDKANGQLLERNGTLVGSRLIGQAFTAPGYFHSRPSAAGNGYDAANSGGSNYAPTNQKLIDRIKGDAQTVSQDRQGTDVPVDLITTSASGLDPDITPASADFQLARVARERHLAEPELRKLVEEHTKGREFGFLGERRVNVLELNLALDQLAPTPPHH